MISVPKCIPEQTDYVIKVARKITRKTLFSIKFKLCAISLKKLHLNAPINWS